MELKHKIMIAAGILVTAMIIFFFSSREKFTNTETGRKFKLRGLPMRYGAVTSNPDSASTKTWATYEQLADIPDHDIPYYDVLPDMMHLPPLRDIYNKPVREQKLDPISGIPESMYTSPRVPLTDFKSETTRDYQVYQ